MDNEKQWFYSIARYKKSNIKKRICKHSKKKKHVVLHELAAQTSWILANVVRGAKSRFVM